MNQNGSTGKLCINPILFSFSNFFLSNTVCFSLKIMFNLLLLPILFTLLANFCFVFMFKPFIQLMIIYNVLIFSKIIISR